MTLVIGVTLPTGVVMASDSRTVSGTGIVPPYDAKMRSYNDHWLVGYAGMVEYWHAYLTQLESVLQDGGDPSDPVRHRAAQTQLWELGKCPWQEEPECPAVELLLARETSLFKASHTELPYRIKWEAIGSGARLAHFVLGGNGPAGYTALLHMSEYEVAQQLHRIIRDASNADATIGGPGYWARTSDLPHIHRFGEEDD